jgi:hypothetical protein
MGNPVVGSVVTFVPAGAVFVGYAIHLPAANVRRDNESNIFLKQETTV